MRVPAAALAVLLLVAICSLAQADPGVSKTTGLSQYGIKDHCCFSTISRRIPDRFIVSAYRTSNACPKEGVVLVTKNGRHVCADPKAPWVQKHLEDFEFIDF